MPESDSETETKTIPKRKMDQEKTKCQKNQHKVETKAETMKTIPKRRKHVLQEIQVSFNQMKKIIGNSNHSIKPSEADEQESDLA